MVKKKAGADSNTVEATAQAMIEDPSSDYPLDDVDSMDPVSLQMDIICKTFHVVED